MKRGELVWFVSCVICLLIWIASAAFFDKTPGWRFFSCAMIVIETVFIMNSWRKLTCEKSKSS